MDWLGWGVRQPTAGSPRVLRPPQQDLHQASSLGEYAGLRYAELRGASCEALPAGGKGAGGEIAKLQLVLEQMYMPQALRVDEVEG